MSGHNSITEPGLSHPWPDPPLTRAFSEVLAVFHRLFALEEEARGAAAVQRAYRTICSWVRCAALAPPCPPARKRSAEWSAVQSLTQRLKHQYPGEWLQRVASLLAGLMHFAVDHEGRGQLVNRRRPRNPFTTYPSSPALAELLGDAILSYLFTEPIPPVCRNIGEAHRFVERALDFRILDPSMETGQLLLATASAGIRCIHQRHPPGGREALLLVRSFLEKLCADCLWGIDRNDLAVDTVRTLFDLLGMGFGLAGLDLPHMSTGDALATHHRPGHGSFDGVINNPPWGESLAREERERVRRDFASVCHHLDTYVAFMELAVQCLKPGGAFAVVLPAQMVGARNAGALRALLLERASLDHVFLLPRTPFARATVRGILLLGRTDPHRAPSNIRLTFYPLVKRLADAGQPRSLTVSSAILRDRGCGSWWPAIASMGSAPAQGTVPLRRLGEVFLGVQVYHRGRGSPPQSAEVVRQRPFSFTSAVDGAVPAVRGRDVSPFFIYPPSCFIRFGRWLARTGPHSGLRGCVRVFLRELCRRDGRLSAAIAEDGYFPLHGVLTVVPRAIDARLLVAILNSASAAEYVRSHATSFVKVDFQKVTVQELYAMPIPIAAVKPSERGALGLPEAAPWEQSRCQEILAAVAEWSTGPPTSARAADRFLDRLDRLVGDLFHAGDSE
ncbi:MAG: N-6 DNA methylase [Acidobacteria bacterium]|nr:N-6 DNA methylase [Acidobacteriota bacterium]